MPEPLLCELHAHTTWSDGALTPLELVDLYGSAGFDVLAITDHVVRDGTGGLEARWPVLLALVEAPVEVIARAA
jgi:predicted metal-dependent phosphoesterase TrpH